MTYEVDLEALELKHSTFEHKIETELAQNIMQTFFYNFEIFITANKENIDIYKESQACKALFIERCLHNWHDLHVEKNNFVLEQILTHTANYIIKKKSTYNEYNVHLLNDFLANFFPNFGIEAVTIQFIEALANTPGVDLSFKDEVFQNCFEKRVQDLHSCFRQCIYISINYFLDTLYTKNVSIENKDDVYKLRALLKRTEESAIEIFNKNIAKIDTHINETDNVKIDIAETALRT